MSLALIVGCQQQVKPPVTEIPKPEISQSAPPPVNEPPVTEIPKPEISPSERAPINEPAKAEQKPLVPEQIDWNRGSREIARTELSPITRQAQESQGTKPTLSVTPDHSGAIPLEVTPTIQPIDETPVVSEDSVILFDISEPAPTTTSDIEPEIDTAPVLENPIEVASEKLSRNQPELAILTINTINPKSLSKEQRADVLRIKGQAYRQLNMSIAALRFDAERLRYLNDNALNAASRQILGELEELPERILQDLSAGTDLLAGMAHALLLKKVPSDDGTLRWLRKYRTHPLLRAGMQDYDFLTAVDSPKDFDVTVLLPLSGDLGNAGRAIRDGMLFEYQRRRSEFGVALRIIDTEKLSHDELTAIGQSTQSEFIIGPLQKDNVVALLESKPRLPVLVLNHIKTDSPDRLAPAYSLSLAIEDDAKSTVNQIAREEDRPHVVVLHTNSPLGLRAAEAVDEQLTLIGGSSGGKFALDAKKPETAIRKAFGVNDSENRRRELSKTLGLRLEHTPRIRQDMTAVVVHTDPKKAQQIRPLMDFYYLDETPVYLIGAYRPDLIDIAEDLRNSHLMVTPWDIGTNEKQVLVERANAQGVFGSLVGVGIDAMHMAMQLGFGGPTSIQGQTGYLTLGSDSMIHRQLSSIQITNDQEVIANRWEPLPSLLQSELLDAEQ